MSVFWAVKNDILAHKVDHLVDRFFTVKAGKIVKDFTREVSFKVIVKKDFKIFIEVNVVLVGFNRLSTAQKIVGTSATLQNYREEVVNYAVKIDPNFRVSTKKDRKLAQFKYLNKF